MSNTLLPLSGKVDPVTVALCQSVAETAKELNTPILVVGASARDLVMHYGYGAKIERATTDIDFGIHVPSWDRFQSLKQALLAKGFQATKIEHRIISPNNIRVDIVPFGGIEDSEANIVWPPNGDQQMNVLGFQEACEHALLVQLQKSPPVAIPVASAPGMVLLKVIAWMNREPIERRKDASDLHYLMETYENIPTISDNLYQNQQLMEHYAWDLTLASAHQLGIDSKGIAKKNTRSEIEKLLNEKHKTLKLETLITEMNGARYDRSAALTNAFTNGFLNRSN